MLRRLFNRVTQLRPSARARPINERETLHIEYAPRIDGRPDPGEVVWAWIPFEDDPRQGKDRPAVVIGHLGRDLAVIPLTSRDQRGRPDCVEVGTGGWDPERRPSWAKLDRLLRVPPARVRREGSALDRDRFDVLVAAFQAYRHG